MPPTTGRQLSLDVEPHPAIAEDTFVVGTLKVKGEYRVGRNLQPGERIRVVISDADGQVLDTKEAELDGPAFPLIKDKGAVIGVERRHTANIVE